MCIIVYNCLLIILDYLSCTRHPINDIMPPLLSTTGRVLDTPPPAPPPPPPAFLPPAKPAGVVEVEVEVAWSWDTEKAVHISVMFSSNRESRGRGGAFHNSWGWEGGKEGWKEGGGSTRGLRGVLRLVICARMKWEKVYEICICNYISISNIRE